MLCLFLNTRDELHVFACNKGKLFCGANEYYKMFLTLQVLIRYATM